MITKQFSDFDISPLAIINDEFKGFREDYLILDSLLRKYNPKSVFEIGCNRGTGTRIIKNAVPNADVYSLDMPFGMGDAPLYSGTKDYTGINCDLPFTLLRGDSTTFDYSLYPCEAYFCDATHEEENVFIETCGMLQQKPNLIVWHDVDIIGVYNGIIRAFEHEKMETFYYIYRVIDTRIAYAVKI